MLNKVPPEFEPVKARMDHYYPITEEHKNKLEESLQIITRYSRIEQYHRQEWMQSRLGDPGLNFNAFSSYFEQPDDNHYIKVTTTDGHPNQVGSDLLAEYIHYNLTQHELLENAGFEPFISSKYLK